MTRRRYELTDGEWSIVAPLLANKARGVPRVYDRRVVNGIIWRFRTGSSRLQRRNVSVVQPTLAAIELIAANSKG